MKLNKENLSKKDLWQGYILPAFDVEAMVNKTKKEPIWLHMGAGNIFRIFPAVLQQTILEAGLTDRGITVCECYDEEIIERVFTPFDNLSLSVILKTDGTVDKKITASVAEAISANSQRERLMEVCSAKSLQMISFTITEKGYNVPPNLDKANVLVVVAEGLAARHKAGAPPLALVSMDNCSKNGDLLKSAVKKIAAAMIDNGSAEKSFMDYIETLAFPCSMIDKITPRPSNDVSEKLTAEGYEGAEIITTKKGTWISSFVIAEESEYLVIENDFPNGRPPLEKAGVIFTDKDTVEKVEKMKVCTCLNPLHTVLGIAGCLLGYKTISQTIEDKRLRALIEEVAYNEAMPVVTDPGVINPKEFLEEVLNKRFPNPFIKDTPQRIAEDTSFKIPIRFGETLKLRKKAGLSNKELKGIPYFVALWLRYLLAVNDKGNAMPVELDSGAAEIREHLKGLQLGHKSPYDLKPILSNVVVFGIDLYEAEIGNKAEEYFAELISAPGTVEDTLRKYFL